MSTFIPPPPQPQSNLHPPPNPPTSTIHQHTHPLPSHPPPSHPVAQIAKTLGSMSIRYRSATFVLDRYLMDIDPRVCYLGSSPVEYCHDSVSCAGIQACGGRWWAPCQCLFFFHSPPDTPRMNSLPTCRVFENNNHHISSSNFIPNRIQTMKDRIHE